MAFSPPGIQPPLLCVSSNHGTVHLFRVEAAPRCELIMSGQLSWAGYGNLSQRSDLTVLIQSVASDNSLTVSNA